MKVALCLQGQPRNWRPSLPYLEYNVIKKYNADVFGHTWWDKELVGKKYQVAPFAPPDKTYLIEDNVIDQLQDTYKFIKFCYDKPMCFLGDKVYRTGLQDKHDGTIDSLKSRYFSLKRVLTLLEDYEKEKGFEYDWVCISRYDIRIDFMPDLNTLDKSKFYVEDWMHSGRKWIMNDNFMIFGKKHKFVYKSLYDDFDKNYEMMLNMPEEYLNIVRGTEIERCKVINGEEFMAMHLLFHGAIQDSIQTKTLKVHVIP